MHIIERVNGKPVYVSNWVFMKFNRTYIDGYINKHINELNNNGKLDILKKDIEDYISSLSLMDKTIFKVKKLFKR